MSFKLSKVSYLQFFLLPNLESQIIARIDDKASYSEP